MRDLVKLKKEFAYKTRHTPEIDGNMDGALCSLLELLGYKPGQYLITRGQVDLRDASPHKLHVDLNKRKSLRHHV